MIGRHRNERSEDSYRDQIYNTYAHCTIMELKQNLSSLFFFFREESPYFSDFGYMSQIRSVLDSLRVTKETNKALYSSALHTHLFCQQSEFHLGFSSVVGLSYIQLPLPALSSEKLSLSLIIHQKNKRTIYLFSKY